MAYKYRYIDIILKPSDFKICNQCGRINWCENEICIDCGSNSFKYDPELVESVVSKESEYYENEGYTEREANNIFIEV